MILTGPVGVKGKNLKYLRKSSKFLWIDIQVPSSIPAPLHPDTPLNGQNTLYASNCTCKPTLIPSSKKIFRSSCLPAVWRPQTLRVKMRSCWGMREHFLILLVPTCCGGVVPSGWAVEADAISPRPLLVSDSPFVRLFLVKWVEAVPSGFGNPTGGRRFDGKAGGSYLGRFRRARMVHSGPVSCTGRAHFRFPCTACGLGALQAPVAPSQHQTT